MSTTASTTGESEPHRQLRRSIELRGLKQVAAQLGLSRETVLRYLANIDGRPGSREQLERLLRERAVARANVVPANGKAATEEEVDAMVAELRAGNAGERGRLSRTTGGR